MTPQLSTGWRSFPLPHRMPLGEERQRPRICVRFSLSHRMGEGRGEGAGWAL
jgi:hypothetical protein